VNAKHRDLTSVAGWGIDFFGLYMSNFPQVAEVFVSDRATKTFSFVAFFVEGVFWGLIYA